MAELEFTNPSKPLPMRDAARILGFGEDVAAARRLSYLVRKKENETGAQIIIGGGRRGKRMMVTLGALRAHYAELVSDDVYVGSIIRELWQSIEDKVAADHKYIRNLGARVRALEMKQKSCESNRS